MRKVFVRPIYHFQEDKFFSPIREKLDYALLLILSMRTLLDTYESRRSQPTSKMKLIIDKMGRLFFYKSDKYFSVSFPFRVNDESDGNIEITSINRIRIDRSILSDISGVLKNKSFADRNSFLDYYTSTETDCPLDSILILEEIFRNEPGYIRYDVDPDHENGNMHPLKHLDLNYSQHCTFKLGSKVINSEQDFEDMMDIKKECFHIIK